MMHSVCLKHSKAFEVPHFFTFKRWFISWLYSLNQSWCFLFPRPWTSTLVLQTSVLNWSQVPSNSFSSNSIWRPSQIGESPNLEISIYLEILVLLYLILYLVQSFIFPHTDLWFAPHSALRTGHTYWRFHLWQMMWARKCPCLDLGWMTTFWQ